MGVAGLYIIDGVDIYTTFGAVFAKGSYDGLFAYPTAKEPLQNNWFEQDGLDIDLSELYYEPKNVTIHFLLSSTVSVADLIAKRDGLIALLNGAGYRKVSLIGYGRSFNLRYVSSGSPSVFGLDDNGLSGLEFDAEFVMDDPLQMFKGSDGTLRIFDKTFDATFGSSGLSFQRYAFHLVNNGTVSLDGANLKEYGMAVKTLAGTALDGDTLKEPLIRSFERLSGTIADCSTVAMKKSSRELQLSIIAIGASVDEILNNYCALFSDLTVAGHRVVEYGLLGKTFNCYYQSQSDLSLTDMRLNSEICMMEFTINLKTIN